MAGLGGCKTAVAGELRGALRSGCLLPDTLGLESEPILADFGADTGFANGVRTNIRHFRC